MKIAQLLAGAMLALAAPVLAQTTMAPQPAPTPGTPAAAPTATPVPGTPGTVSATPVVVAPAVGVKVFDPSGTEVGTIKSLDAQYATITTAKGEVKLPAAGVGPGANGAAVGLTAAQIDAAVAQAAPAKASATADTPTAAPTKARTKKSLAASRRDTARHAR